jgi:hypothetical protein
VAGKSSRGLRRSQRPKRMRKARGVVYASGPRPLGLARDPVRTTGPGEPPPNFVGGNTSRSEWFIYWALANYFNDPPNPRIPPFFGGAKWGYQIIAIGQASGQLGSANIDFVVYAGTIKLGIRVETSRYHINVNAQQQAFDQMQMVRAGMFYDIVQIFEQDFINDLSGRAAMQVVRETMEYGQSMGRPAPIGSGRGIRIRS